MSTDSIGPLIAEAIQKPIQHDGFVLVEQVEPGCWDSGVIAYFEIQIGTIAIRRGHIF